MTRATGTFEVKLAPTGNDSTPEGPNLGRMSIEGGKHSYVFDYSLTKD